MTLVCIGDEFGQLGNRLVRAAHVLAFCREQNFAFLDLPFAPYARYLTNSASSLALCSPRVPIPPAIAARLHRRLAHHGPRLACGITRVPVLASLRHQLVHEITLPPSDRLDLSQSDLAHEFRKYRIVILKGWYFRCYSLVQTHRDWLREFLRPNVSPSDSICQAVRNARAAGNMVIGMHIRAGDYRTWRGGRYFFPPDFYLKQMHLAAREFQGQNVTFLICSNEPIDQSLLNGFDCIMATGDIVSDLAALSQCDLIFGPPSTYSLWAAFLGQAGLWHVTSPDETLSIDRFAKSNDLNWVLEQ